MDTDVLAPCITRTSVTMALTHWPLGDLAKILDE